MQSACFERDMDEPTLQKAMKRRRASLIQYYRRFDPKYWSLQRTAPLLLSWNWHGRLFCFPSCDRASQLADNASSHKGHQCNHSTTSSLIYGRYCWSFRRCRHKKAAKVSAAGDWMLPLQSQHNRAWCCCVS